MGMVDANLNKHFINFEITLKKAKKDFESKWNAPLASNASLDDFERLKTLGVGSFGRVVLVKHREADNFYAMKIIEKDHLIKTKQVVHTKSEIRIMDAVNFEFLISLKYYFRDNVYLFIVMPFIKGGEMFSHLRRVKKFDETLAKFYAAQVILAIEYLHFLGIVYRDLKPENILIDLDGYIKLTDYGFCKKIDDQRTYTFCGTPEYLAPEIILSQGYNKSADWWAIGILIYEMNAGYPPFHARDQMKIYEKIVIGKYQFPTHFLKALRDLVINFVQVDRTKRLGVLKGGIKDIKSHEWFKQFDWEALLARKIKPLFKPIAKCIDDTSNFEPYEELPLRTNSVDEHPNEFSITIV